MEKTKYYPRVKFLPEAILEAFNSFHSATGGDVTYSRLFIDFENEQCLYDTDEEFFSDCRKQCERFRYQKEIGQSRFEVGFYYGRAEVCVGANTKSQIETVFEVFEKHAPQSSIPEPPKSQQRPTIFIGHGRSSQWRDLKDHLHEKHRIQVEAYEIGARAGHGIRDILEDMLRKSSLALLVLTAEDETVNENMRPRQNVVHELGLFQGRLGFHRAIVLLEEGTEGFSNIQGIQQLHFGKNNIKEVFGDVIATIGREFGIGVD